MPLDLSRLEQGLAVITNAIGDAEEAFLKDAAASGLTPRQMHHLDTLSSLGSPSPSEIAVALQLRKPSITALVSQLSALGFIRKVTSDMDRRGYHVHVTKKGMKLIHEHSALHRRLAQSFAAALPPKELAALCTLLEKVARKIGKDHGLPRA